MTIVGKADVPDRKAFREGLNSRNELSEKAKFITAHVCFVLGVIFRHHTKKKKARANVAIARMGKYPGVLGDGITRRRTV